MSPSAVALWEQYRALNPGTPVVPCGTFHFCDNPEDADACAELVVRGIKRATAASVAELALEGVPLPRPGDVSIVTQWDGKAVAVILTIHVEIRRLGDIDEAFARREGEGDGTLAWWRTAHEAYYGRVLEGSGVCVDDDLEIVCEHFERVF